MDLKEEVGRDKPVPGLYQELIPFGDTDRYDMLEVE